MSALGTALLTVAAGTLPAQPAYAAPPGPVIRADTNRDGRITADDDAGKDTWTRDRGALMLPNMDDDQRSCPTAGPDGVRLPDQRLADCDDASDNVVNGPADLADLAPLRISAAPHTTTDTTATVAADPASRKYVRIFAEREGRMVELRPGDRLTADELRHGIQLGVEAKDFVRDPRKWAGFTDIVLTVNRGGTTTQDRVRLRVAPLVFQHDLMPMQHMMTADHGTEPAEVERGKPYDPAVQPEPVEPGEAEFRRDLRRGLDQAGLTAPLYNYPTGGDVWMQDLFKTAYASIPAPGGREHRVTVIVRSADVMPGTATADFPLRDASRSAFPLLRGPGTGVIQQYDPGRVGSDDSQYYGSFSSTGNFGTLPPYTWQGHHYPVGRVLYGGTGGKESPDATFTRMLAAQGYQRPTAVDTSWLGVGHLDEFLSFVPARNDRGWVAVVADPDLGRSLLEDLAADGRGGEPLVRGIAPEDTEDPGLTVADALRKPSLTEGTEIARKGIDSALRTLREEAGLTERYVVRVPALFNRLDLPAGYPRRNVVANYLPGAANGVSTGTGVYLAPRQHAPKSDGQDVFERVTEKALSGTGTRISWVEDWDYSHHRGTVGGEVHCATNALRDMSGTRPWWTERD
ncbi:protein-arginine deiminase domain-containing protein [Streptomyces sp. RY43-2]|uniref:Protein-arginine deiminase domain-containing protein n=1 Tax=Streptomyces macrolidinus TaxID=2952607 RepID=A0ABT0ZJD1_9ACTN|nr:protein-arginine deiminase domain-containing protein [Streptomyces macrolidinus]MCN9243700.1 protein-arginine deiminase domain-containing protein [Streptomyces macrolidinus]